MKIGKPEAPPTVNGAGAVRPAPTDTAAAGGARKAGAVAPGQEASAQVELSEGAAKLLGSGELSAADFDSAKVERISQAIADGTYKVNADVIADKLIANAQELLGKVSK